MLSFSASASLLIQDGGFETPDQGTGGRAYTYNPTGTAWKYQGSGITSLPSDWASTYTAPEGHQVGFVQGVGSTLSQDFTASAGIYALSFFDAGRQDYGSYSGYLTYQVKIDGNVLGTFAKSGNQGFALENLTMELTSGTHTLSFVGLELTPGYNTTDQSIFVDNVQLAPTAVPEPSTWLSGIFASSVLLGAFARRFRK